MFVLYVFQAKKTRFAASHKLTILNMPFCSGVVNLFAYRQVNSQALQTKKTRVYINIQNQKRFSNFQHKVTLNTIYKCIILYNGNIIFNLWCPFNLNWNTIKREKIKVNYVNTIKLHCCISNLELIIFYSLSLNLSIFPLCKLFLFFCLSFFSSLFLLLFPPVSFCVCVWIICPKGESPIFSLAEPK